MASCTICYESLGDSSDICSSICGHIFHLHCLQQWLQQSNTCPMCNRSNPQPHRIFLDLKSIDEPAAASTGYGIVVKGLKPTQNEPLLTTVMRLIHVMQVPLKESDILSTLKVGNKHHVYFRTSQQRETFLKNRRKLKFDPQASTIRIYEVLDDATEKLFHYSHKLKEIGYKIIYAENSKVYVRKDNNYTAVQILSQSHVDSLYSSKVLDGTIIRSPTIQSNVVPPRCPVQTSGYVNGASIRLPTNQRYATPPRYPTQRPRSGQNYLSGGIVAHEQRDCNIL